MNGRAGGEADKYGNRYEAAWAVRHALYCIMDGTSAITCEDADEELQKGSEFTYQSGRGIEVHQLKRRKGSHPYWSIADLHVENVLENARDHAAAGRQFIFVSQIPAGRSNELAPMADRARRAANLEQFLEKWIDGLYLKSFTEMAAPERLKSTERVFEMLTKMRFEVQSERDLLRGNALLAEVCLEGARGELITAGMQDILFDSLGSRLTRVELLEQLAHKGITPLHSTEGDHARETVTDATDSWLRSVRHDLLQPPIERREAQLALEELSAAKICMLVGSAGSGKSAVTEQLVERLHRAGSAVLAFRLDRFPSFVSTRQIGSERGLPHSPVVALARAADSRPAVLVIDQLDAVSEVSGRTPHGFDVVNDLIAEAAVFPDMTVVLVTRRFDVENDDRLRRLQQRAGVKTVHVMPFDEEQISTAVTSMGLDPTTLSSTQRALLANPFHLVLLQSLAEQDGAMTFDSSETLLDRFWDQKRIRAGQRFEGELRFSAVIQRIADEASDRQTLSVPVDVLEAGDLVSHASVLESEHVLVRDGNQIAFFHEQFFDYAFARMWNARGESLVDFLRSGEQELFRRAQVRQILQRLRDRDLGRFRRQFEELMLDERVRYHLKDVALASWAGVQDPTHDELDLLLRIAETHPAYEARLWQRMRQPQWILLLMSEGIIDTWIGSSDPALQDRGIWFLTGAVSEHGDAVAEVIGRFRDSEKYPQWLPWVARFSNVAASRGLLELVLDALRAGVIDDLRRDFWYCATDIADEAPAWGLELLRTYFVDSPRAFELSATGELARLDGRDHYTVSRIIRGISMREPDQFAQFAVPYVLRVMAATARPQQAQQPIYDRHFSDNIDFGIGHVDDDRQLDEVLLATTIEALVKSCADNFDGARPLLDSLATSNYGGAHLILHRTLASIAPVQAEWAAEILLDGPASIQSGEAYRGETSALDLLAAIAPYVAGDTHERLEAKVRDLVNPYESRRSGGSAAFAHLSALEEGRLTRAGLQRLLEYQRKFQEDRPSPVPLVFGGMIVSPIPPEAAKRMNDTQWLTAMTHYDKEYGDLETLKGGAHQLSGELQTVTTEQPERFARLALRLTTDLNPVYAGAILRGLNEAASDAVEPTLVFDAARHLVSLGHSEVDRWLGWALRNWSALVPDDIVMLISERVAIAAGPDQDLVVQESNGRRDAKSQQLVMQGMNSARGALVQTLALLTRGRAGAQRTALVLPRLDAIASDPHVAVRAMAAQLISSVLLHARPEAVRAYWLLLETDDSLLAVDSVKQLTVEVGRIEPDAVLPVIDRLLQSSESDVRRAGGELAGVAGIWWGHVQYVDQALELDAAVREGLGTFAVQQLTTEDASAVVLRVLRTLCSDPAENVRETVAQMAGWLREKPLRPHIELLKVLIESPAFVPAVAQLFITLQHAPDQVSDLVIVAARRFIKVLGAEVGDIQTAAAGDAHYVSELIVRALAQARSIEEKRELLDLLDGLLMRGAFGIEEAVREYDRA